MNFSPHAALQGCFPGGRFRRPGWGRAAFTLIEIMIVVGIMGIILTMGVPMVYKVWHKQPMSRAISEVVEVCSHARAQSIMQSKEVDVIFHPQEGTFGIGSAPSGARPADAAAPGGGAFDMPAAPVAGSGTSGQFDRSIMIYMLDIGKQPHDFKDDETAVVRFFPNGTCDELTLVIGTDPINTYQIKLEVTTGLASVESNARKFR